MTKESAVPPLPGISTRKLAWLVETVCMGVDLSAYETASWFRTILVDIFGKANDRRAAYTWKVYKREIYSHDDNVVPGARIETFRIWI